MGNEPNYDEQLESIMDRLADSATGLSDEEITVEFRETGSDPVETAEQTRAVLQAASNALKIANTRLWDLGHTVNPDCWYRKDASFHNNCLICGALISFTPSTNGLSGLGATARCTRRDVGLVRMHSGLGM